MKRKGDLVSMRRDAIENYGKQWRGVLLVVTSVSTRYMPAEEFFRRGQPEGYHPGYDSGAGGGALYDLKRDDTGEDLPFSLYDWEVR